MNKKTIIGVGLALATLSTLSFAATKIGSTNKADFATVQAAIESNNYASLPDTVKTKLTEAQFTKMVDKYSQHSAVEESITAGDYAAFKAAMIAQIPTEAEFQTMVAHSKSRAESKAAIETAVKNNDFTAYKTAITAEKAAMEANRPEGAPENIKQRPEPSEDQLQQRFDKLVAYYAENGSLPDHEKGPGAGGPGFGGGMRGHSGHGGPQDGARGMGAPTAQAE